MEYITLNNITENNLKDVSVKIPLNKLVVVVGLSGSGKSSLIYEVLYNSANEKNKYNIKNLPKTFAISQKVDIPKNSKLSLGEFNMSRLKEQIKKLEKGQLLIVDEPCAGFNKQQREEILAMLRKSVSEGKSIIAIEHVKELIAGADYIIEMGPGAGKYGGKIIFQGNLNEFKKAKTLTSSYVFNSIKESTKNERFQKRKSLRLSNINRNNLKDFEIDFPLNSLIAISGPSGSGKSTILDIVYRALFKGQNAWKIRISDVKVDGKGEVRRSYLVTQSPLGSHHSSTPATYLGIWDEIRNIYSDLPEAKKLKLTKSDFVITSKILLGKDNFSNKILQVKYKNYSIQDLLTLTIDEVEKIFSDSNLIKRKLNLLQEIGLGYLVLNQPSNSLSGGEAQRVKLVKVLSKKLGDRSIYIFDTPSRGLHLSDIPVLVKVFRKIIDKNNTIVIADNREELLENCDKVIELVKH